MRVCVCMCVNIRCVRLCFDAKFVLRNDGGPPSKMPRVDEVLENILEKRTEDGSEPEEDEDDFDDDDDDDERGERDGRGKKASKRTKTSLKEREALATAAKKVGEKYGIRGDTALFAWLSKPVCSNGIGTQQVNEIIAEAKSQRKIHFVRRLLKKWSHDGPTWRKYTQYGRRSEGLEPNVESTKKHLTPSVLKEHANMLREAGAETAAATQLPEMSGSAKITGAWTETEKAQVQRAMQDYVAEHAPGEGLSYLMPASRTDDGKRRAKKGAWVEIAGNVPTRTLKAVYTYGVAFIDPGTKKGKWTSEESAQLKGLVEKHGSKWSEISKHFKDRSPQALYDHWKNYYQFANSSTGAWTDAEVKKLYAAVRKQVQESPSALDEEILAICDGKAHPDTDLKNRIVLSWIKVAKEHGTRTAKQCRTKFFLTTRTVTQASKWSKEDDGEFLRRLMQANALGPQTDEEWSELWSKYPVHIIKARWQEMQASLKKTGEDGLPLTFKRQLESLAVSALDS